MTLTNEHLEAIRAAAATVEFGSLTIKAGTDDHFDIVIENRIRLSKETAGKVVKATDTANTHRTQ